MAGLADVTCESKKPSSDEDTPAARRVDICAYLLLEHGSIDEEMVMAQDHRKNAASLSS